MARFSVPVLFFVGWVLGVGVCDVRSVFCVNECWLVLDMCLLRALKSYMICYTLDSPPNAFGT